jgi:hypothetical protein
MNRDECRCPGCDNEPGQQDQEDYRRGSFCSVKCDVKYDHLKADARDARRAEPEESGSAW